ncbi:NAD(P)/FAD-dependent oxidoreductase [Faunimonas sp. B44]|uniref:NAD(P)/FAD-dependent oxidoreductase n=1 Tax=Faunimonas sp. B44 TaxID=3461493 RepID=UPI004044859C
MAFDKHFDVVIVGGGAVGSAVAYFLKRVLDFPGSVALVEQDPTFRRAATMLSAASIRQQFSTPENIRASRFGLAFLRGLADEHGPEFDPQLRESGYLILATPEGAPLLASSHRIQIAEGADVALLDREGLANRFAWLSLEAIGAGSLGLSGEGWFDAATLLGALRHGARAAGAVAVTGAVTGIARKGAAIEGVHLANGSALGCGTLVNAAGTAAARIAALAGRTLPVEPRKRTVFVVDCPDGPNSLPLVADPSGVWIRPEGSGYLTGYSPPASEDSAADPSDFDPDHAIFEERLWPALARRIPAFERLKVKSAWVGHYDFNTLDQNAILGPDPEVPNLLYANDFSGHGLQQSPAVGRALAEIVAFGAYRSIDFGAFGFERIAAGRPVIEAAVI